MIITETGEKFPGKGGFIYDPARAALTFTDITCDCAYSDKISGTLYIVKNVSLINKLYKWDSNTTNINMKWLTKTIVTSNCNMAAARIDAKRYPTTVKFYGDKKLIFTKEVYDGKIFKLPSGYKARQWQVEISGAGLVQGVFMATSVKELRV
jgi:hypothetical protein